MDIKKIVLWLVVIMVVSLSVAAVIAVVSGYTPGSLTQNSNQDRFTTTVDEERVFPQEGINEIQVRTVSPDINIITVDDREIKAHLHGKAVSGISGPVVELTAKSQGGKLVIEVKHRPNTSLFGSSNVVLDIYVPESFNEEMRLDTVSGDMAASNLGLSRLAAKSVSGEIDFFSINTTGASVETTSGNIRLDGFSGDLEFNSVSGDLDVGYTAFDSDIRGKTVSGDVKIKLPANAAFNLDASTVSGDISCQFPVTVTGSISKRGLRGTVGRGDNSITIETVSGSAGIYNQ